MLTACIHARGVSFIYVLALVGPMEDTFRLYFIALRAERLWRSIVNLKIAEV